MKEGDTAALAEGARLHGGNREYVMVKVLGHGGFGITYLATGEFMVDNVPVEGKFAVKEHFPADFCERMADGSVKVRPGKETEFEHSLSDFLAEARELQKIATENDNIIKVNEVVEANGTAYYVMQYINGKTLREYVDEKGPLPYQEAIDLLTPIIDAVGFLHEEMINHLDIKPANIMLNKTSKGVVPVLIDFGLYVHFTKDGARTSYKNLNGVSHGYSPTEQYLGLKKFNAATDIYALAATLFFLLTGNKPARAGELEQKDIREGLEGKAPAYAVEGICKGLREYYGHRTQSIGEFKRDLGIGVTREDDMTEVAGYQEDGNGSENIEREEKPQPRPKRSSKLKWIIVGIVALLIVGAAIAIPVGINSHNRKIAEEYTAKGSEAYAQEDYVHAYDYYMQAADKGNSEAMTYLGVMYSKGLGVPQDYDEGMKWYLKAADKGNGEAMAEIGRSYFYGYGVEQDYEEAFKWFQQSADLEDALGTVWLGRIYDDGEVVPQDTDKAWELYQKAAEMGNTNAMYIVGLRYLDGKGVPQNYAEAKRWLELGAERGEEMCINSLGTLYLDGIGVEKDYAKAKQYFEEAAEKGESNAMNNLGLMYCEGLGVEKDYGKALAWFRKAIEIDNNEGALYSLGLMYQKGQGVRQNKEEALNLFTQAAEQGNGVAMNDMGCMYFNGDGIPQNIDEAVKWFRKSADAGDVGGMQNLGGMYLMGTGVKQNYVEAKKWFEMAAAKNSREAMYYLGRMYHLGQGMPKDDAKAREWWEKSVALGDPNAAEALRDL